MPLAAKVFMSVRYPTWKRDLAENMFSQAVEFVGKYKDEEEKAKFATKISQDAEFYDKLIPVKTESQTIDSLCLPDPTESLRKANSSINLHLPPDKETKPPKGGLTVPSGGGSLSRSVSAMNLHLTVGQNTGSDSEEDEDYLQKKQMQRCSSTMNLCLNNPIPSSQTVPAFKSQSPASSGLVPPSFGGGLQKTKSASNLLGALLESNTLPMKPSSEYRNPMQNIPTFDIGGATLPNSFQELNLMVPQMPKRKLTKQSSLD